MIDAISNALADPTLAFVLYICGTLAILYEIFKPGSIFPGVAGGAMVVGAILASRVMPVRPFAIMGIAVGIGLVATEIYVRTRGVIAFVGLAILVWSATTFIDLAEASRLLDGSRQPWLSQTASLVASIAVSVVAAVAVLVAGRRIVDHESAALGAPIPLVGQAGEWREHGMVVVSGCVWRGESVVAVAPGTRVVVTGAKGFLLTVAPIDESLARGA